MNNDPIFVLNGIRLVGTETSTPAGTRNTDAAEPLIIGNRDTADATHDGFIGETRLSDKVRSSLEAIANYNAEKENTDFITVGTEIAQA